MSDFYAILARLPSLKNLLDTYGSMSLFEYAKKHYTATETTSPLGLLRKEEFLNFLQGYVTKKYGKDFTKTVINALSKNYAVSTAEHHGPMGHPFFFQSALLRAISHPELPVINFATSHVSLGNSSYPRGLVFHGDGESAPKEYLHLPFSGSRLRMCPVFRYPAYTGDDIETHCIKRLRQYRESSHISEKSYQKILHFLHTYVLNEATLGLSTYSSQITRLNHIWWQDLFPDLPPYISLDAEDIVVELLQGHLQKNTVMKQLLTDITLQPRMEEYFDGISCCFDLSKHSGTYLFWYLDKHHKRHALWREGDELVSQDKSFRIKMDSKEYIYHLQQCHLIPSGLLVYTLFACYYGVTCFGGFAQGEYLPHIQEAFKKVAGESENLSTQASVLNEDMIFIFQKNGEISTALDIFMQDEDVYFLTESQQISLYDSIHRMRHEIERCF